MKKFLSIILAVVMLVAMIPATFVSAADGDIVFDFNAYLKANPSTTRHTDYSVLQLDGLTLNTTGTAATTGALWETSDNTLRWNNTRMDWQTYPTSAGVASSNNKIAFDYTVETAGWYQFSMPFTSNSTATATVAVYDIVDDTVTFLGEVKASTSSNAVYLSAGTHTLLLCGVYSANGTSDALYIQKFIFTKVAEPTGSVVLDDFPTATLELGAEVTDLTAVVNTSYGAHQFSAYGVNLSAANVKYRSQTGDTDNYLKVTYSKAGVVDVATAANTAVGEKGSVSYSITATGEGTTDVTFTPVVGGVEQTALATTKTVTVMGTDYVYDFSAWVKVTDGIKDTRHVTMTADNSPAGLAQADSPSFITWDYMGPGVRFSNVNANWRSSSTETDRNRFVFKLTVPEGKTGWFTPSITFHANAGEAGNYSVYHIKDGVYTYLGDTAVGTSTLRPVNLTAGENYIAFCAVNSVTVSYVTKMSFTKLATAAPTMTAVNTGSPADLSVGKSASYDATVSMSDGTSYLFPRYAINTTNYLAAGDPNTYLKIESNATDVVSVTRTGAELGNYDKSAYTLAGLKEGTATITYTPVVNGVEQTALATTEEISVVEENIIYDFESWYKENSMDGIVPVTEENIPAGFGIADGMADILKWQANSLRVFGVSDTWTEYDAAAPAKASRFAMTVDVPAGKAGWYTPQLTYVGNTGQTGLCSVYHIYDGETTYLGNTVNSGDNYLAPVELKEGINTIAVGVVSDTNGMFMKKLAFYKYEGEQATLTGITVAEPADLTVGETSEAYEITTTMSDGSSLLFPVYAMNPTTYYNAGRNYDTYVKVTATPADIVNVDARTYYEIQGGDQTKYYYTVEAVSDGDVVLSFVPVINGVEKTELKQTKTISVTHPNGNITGDDVSIGLTAIANSKVDAGAKALISGDNGIVAGNVNTVAVGTEVTLTATENDDYTFLYWYNGNSGKILSDAETYTFVAGTSIPVYAKYLAAGEELTEYATASGTLVSADDITAGTEPDVKVKGYKLYVDTVDPVDAEEATVTDESAVYWTKDGKTVAYGTSYTYLKWGNLADPVPVTEGEASDIPAVVLFESNGAYMLELVNFEGKTIIEKGITFGSGVDMSKAVSTTSAKQFTATGEGTATAYVIYRDGAAIRVAYSD